MTGEARASLAALDDEQASSGEIRNARAVISLEEGDPTGALDAVADVLDGTAPVLGAVTVLEAHRWPGSPIANSVTSARRTSRPNGRWRWPSPTG